MANRSKKISRIARSIRELGQIQVNDWDFEGLLRKDVREIEVTNSLRKLGSIRVMEWDFKDVLPAMNKLANQEVDIVGLVKRVADYKVLEWDFRSAAPSADTDQKKLAARQIPAEDVEQVANRLKAFLQFTITGLIANPHHAHVKVAEIAPAVLCFKIVLDKKDMALLIGMEGHTAGAIRHIMKSVAELKGVHALLRIISHEDEVTSETSVEDGP